MKWISSSILCLILAYENCWPRALYREGSNPGVLFSKSSWNAIAFLYKEIVNILWGVLNHLESP